MRPVRLPASVRASDSGVVEEPRIVEQGGLHAPAVSKRQATAAPIFQPSYEPMTAPDPPREYTPFYCEENAWYSCRRHLAAGRDARVTIIGNGDRFVMWNQRAAERPGAPVVWDYHVIVAFRNPGGNPGEGWAIDDPDSYCKGPCTVEDYVAASFAAEAQLRPDYRPRFRLFEGDSYLKILASDRSHMRDENGLYTKPPPPWPPIGNGPSNLLEIIDPAREPAEWLSLAEWRARFQ